MLKATLNKAVASRKLLSGGHAAKLRYVSSNTKVATVNSKGKVTAIKKGSCNIDAGFLVVCYQIMF